MPKNDTKKRQKVTKIDTKKEIVQKTTQKTIPPLFKNNFKLGEPTERASKNTQDYYITPLLLQGSCERTARKIRKFANKK